MTTTNPNRDLDFIQTKVRSLLEAENYAAAIIWIDQLAELSLVGDEANNALKGDTEKALASVIAGSVKQLIVSTLTAANRGRWQTPQFETLRSAVDGLVKLDAQKAGHRILLAECKLLEQSLARSTTERSYASAEELSEFLDHLWNISGRANRLVGANEAEVLPPQKRVELSATALNNARSMLHWIFADALSDWQKARVICEQVKARLLPGLEIYHVRAATASIEKANMALMARNYRLAHSHISAAEKVMRQYTWQH
ncbi:hypothetical protein GC174_15560 [bacterium]|nr:hypothetical protein [bacterium]